MSGEWWAVGGLRPTPGRGSSDALAARSPLAHQARPGLRRRLTALAIRDRPGGRGSRGSPGRPAPAGQAGCAQTGVSTAGGMRAAGGTRAGEAAPAGVRDTSHTGVAEIREE
ncbi:hypothetical protein [Streptomyces sp. NBC_00829]|uniref:hypothetical protein n=1 Tax=Streptomyces sp. NBC_00829 TaxID=2903679 RepID=UPI00386A362F|nr:hypothetical protein OG293_03000 [Streptomyces sp. NBC_00829]